MVVLQRQRQVQRLLQIGCKKNQKKKGGIVNKTLDRPTTYIKCAPTHESSYKKNQFLLIVFDIYGGGRGGEERLKFSRCRLYTGCLERFTLSHLTTGDRICKNITIISIKTRVFFQRDKRRRRIETTTTKNPRTCSLHSTRRERNETIVFLSRQKKRRNRIGREWKERTAENTHGLRHISRSSSLGYRDARGGSIGSRAEDSRQPRT